MIQTKKAQSSLVDDSLSSVDDHRRFEKESQHYDDGLLAFLKVRRSLFGLAYRMIGSAAEAEDIVQEVWLRWQMTERGKVLDPSAFLRTTTIRICINLYQSARLRRETYIDEWFAEPVDIAADPNSNVERKEAVRSAVLILLEKLRPAERAAYVLREAFDYSHRRIAEILRMTEPNVRQMLTRARKRIAGVSWTLSGPTEQIALLEVFTSAIQNGNLTELEGFFASEAISPPNRMTAVL
jgi:RNA polymerase sigma-70 factor (ECF subfamily)